MSALDSRPVVTWNCDKCSYAITDDDDIVDEAREEHLIAHTLRDAGEDEAAAALGDDVAVRTADQDDSTDRTVKPEEKRSRTADDPRWRTWSDEQILEAMRAAAVDGRLTSTKFVSASREHPSLNTVKNRFGSWRAALEAAGLKAPTSGRRPRPAAPPAPRVKAAEVDGIDLVDAAQHLQAIRDEIATLEAKLEATRALLPEAEDVVRRAIG